MRKKILCGIALALLVPGAALAGDGGSRSPVAGWGGFYAGGHLGYAWGSSDLTNSSPPGPPTRTESIDMDGLIGGVQVGYNWQHQGIVFGIVGDVSFADLSGANVSNPPPGPPYTVTADVEWMATLRGRLGLLIRPETLVYAHGGLAVGGIEGTWISTPPGGGPGPFRGSDSSVEVGWVVGAGFEHRLDKSTSVFVEYAHTDFGSRDFSNAAGPAVTFDQDTTVDSVKVGFNVRF